MSELELDLQDGIARLWLNRPALRNALDEALIAELTATLTRLGAMPEVRAVVLGGRGSAFCAGGDLGWMRRMADFAQAENLADARKLAGLMRCLAELPKPTIARVHGPAFAGGMGLVAASDIAVAAEPALFCLSEVRLGLVPSTISPYVLRAMGSRAGRRYMLTGERFDAATAHRLGLIDEVCPAEQLDQVIDGLLDCLRAGGPHALAGTKALTASIAGRPIDDDVVERTADSIARVRATDEARHGIAAFFAKRPPDWA